MLAVALSAMSSLAVAQPRFDPHAGPGQGRPEDRRPDDRHDDHHDWQRGQRMNHDDWERGDRIDYRRNHLRAPPRGYQWRDIDGRFILGAIATGVIADIILNRR